jgi:hypothetical protein
LESRQTIQHNTSHYTIFKFQQQFSFPLSLILFSSRVIQPSRFENPAP